MSDVGIGLILNTLGIADCGLHSSRLGWVLAQPPAVAAGGGLTAPALVPEGAAWPSGLPGPSAPLLLTSSASAGQQKAG